MERSGKKISAGLFGAIFVAFLLPFATFSCQGMELATVGGYDLAFGKDVQTKDPTAGLAGMGQTTEQAGETKDAAAKPANTQENDPNLLAVGALVCAAVGVALSFGRGRGAMLGAAIAGAVGVVTLFVLKSNLASALSNAMKDSQAASGSSGADDLFGNMDLGSMFQVNMKSGWWLALILFLAAAAYNLYLYLKKPVPTYASSAPASQASHYSGVS